ncbi:MAG: DUF916 and DUF3324 domain-containing protein [Schleiferilactobacillus perolens]|uniref:DUF916 and DUF3324 domain-containing protein n=1 Tax=Schleiferilactobacillus perolens TaxID=100468 RepID=UPI0039EBF982
MRKYRWWIILVGGLWLLYVLGSLPRGSVQAATAGNGADFYIAPVYPPNQLNTKLGYFALKVAPGKQYSLSVQVQNISQTSTRTIRLTPTPATTTDSADINYTPVKTAKDPTAQYTLNQFFSKPIAITLKPGEAKVVTFQYVIPASGFRGQILGSIYALDETKSATTKAQFALQNRFAMTLGILMGTNPLASQPITLILRTVKPDMVNHSPVVLANIENQTPQYFRHFTVTAQISRVGRSTVLFTKKITNGRMAPNSSFNLTIPTDKRLTAGNYTLKTTASAQGQVFHFTRRFTVSTAAAQHLQTPQSVRGNSRLAWLIAIAASFAAIILIWIGVLVAKRKGLVNYAPKHS